MFVADSITSATICRLSNEKLFRREAVAASIWYEKLEKDNTSQSRIDQAFGEKSNNPTRYNARCNEGWESHVPYPGNASCLDRLHWRPAWLCIWPCHLVAPPDIFPKTLQIHDRNATERFDLSGQNLSAHKRLSISQTSAYFRSSITSEAVKPKCARNVRWLRVIRLPNV